MLELLEKLDQVKKELDQVTCIKKLQCCQQALLCNSFLYDKIKRHEKDLEMYDEIMEYRKCENEVNFLILAIRKYLKEYMEVGSDFVYEGD